MLDIYDIIAKAMGDGHEVTLEQDGIVVNIKPAQKQEKPKAKCGGQNKLNLDVPKMKALREAGWSLEKIGDEMGCSAQTVANKLKEAEG